MRLATITLVITLVLDQALKWTIVEGLGLRHLLYIEVLPPWFNLTMAWNQGVNFGLLASDSPYTRWSLIALALAISAWVWLWVRREGAGEGAGRMMQLSVGLLVGGALGNVIDRIVWGAVADFLNFTCCGIRNPFAFNVADIAIFIGAFGLIVFAGGKKDP